MTFKDGVSSDFVVGQLWGRKGADLYLLDQMRGRWSFTESCAMVEAMTERCRQKFPRTAPRILIEDKANGPAIIDALKHKVSGIVPVEPDGSKTARAHAITALFEAGNVLLPDRSLSPWVDEYRLELTRFPSAAHDDQCFVAGTKVATPFGERSIEKIKAGDLVLTPFGCRKVLWSGSTGVAEICTRLDVSATLRHPFICKNGSAIPFEDIEGGEQCSKLSLSEMAIWRYRKLLCSMVSSTDAWADTETIILVSQKAMLDERELKDFMLRCGSFIRDRQYLKAMKFTTRTAILLITTTATLSVCRVLTIARRLSSTWTRFASILTRFVPWQANGTEARRGELGIGNTPTQSSWSQRLRRFASCVARSFLQKTNMLNFAVTTAKSSTGTITQRLKSEFARGAGESSRRMLDTGAVQTPVAVPVQGFCENRSDAKRKKVFNLTVEDCHLFYANGFLVHNCDATTQALRYLSAGHRLNIAPQLQRQLQGFRFRR
jgi:predicted phage terminase large subunit-like protein